MLNIVKLSLLLFTLVITQSAQSAPINLTKLNKPQPAPVFQLADPNNKVFNLQHYRGKPLIINFWATWCPPCRAELPAFNRAWAKLKAQGVNMVAVNVGEEHFEVMSFLREFPIDFQVLLDPESESLTLWQLQGLPATYILDANGRVVYQALGEREWDNDELLTKVLALRKK